MTKTEIKEVVRDFIDGKTDSRITLGDVSDNMGGCLYWTKKQMIRKEMIVRFLDFQCRYFDGRVNDQELATCCYIFKNKIEMI